MPCTDYLGMIRPHVAQDELYEADFGSDWPYGENLKGRPPSIPLLTHDAAADTIVPLHR